MSCIFPSSFTLDPYPSLDLLLLFFHILFTSFSYNRFTYFIVEIFISLWFTLRLPFFSYRSGSLVTFKCMVLFLVPLHVVQADGSFSFYSSLWCFFMLLKWMVSFHWIISFVLLEWIYIFLKWTFFPCSDVGFFFMFSWIFFCMFRWMFVSMLFNWLNSYSYSFLRAETQVASRWQSWISPASY